jgi:hypothetical protein
MRRYSLSHCGTVARWRPDKIFREDRQLNAGPRLATQVVCHRANDCLGVFDLHSLFFLPDVDLIPNAKVENAWQHNATGDKQCKNARNFDPTPKVSQLIDLVAKDRN